LPAGSADGWPGRSQEGGHEAVSCLARELFDDWDNQVRGRFARLR
jgi:hypothetical protein